MGLGEEGKNMQQLEQIQNMEHKLSGWDDFAILNAICAGLKVLLCV